MSTHAGNAHGRATGSRKPPPLTPDDGPARQEAYSGNMPEAVQARFDALPPEVRAMFDEVCRGDPREVSAGYG